MSEGTADPDPLDRYAERCLRCGRTDVDDEWRWVEVQRSAPDEDCEFESVDLVFCSQAHAGLFLQESEIDWVSHPADDRSGVRADLFMFGCGLLAIILSVIGLVALMRWLI